MWRSAVQLCLGLPAAASGIGQGTGNVQCSISDGGLAQLARAPALQAGGQRFESVILHHEGFEVQSSILFKRSLAYCETSKRGKRDICGIPRVSAGVP